MIQENESTHICRRILFNDSRAVGDVSGEVVRSPQPYLKTKSAFGYISITRSCRTLVVIEERLPQDSNPFRSLHSSIFRGVLPNFVQEQKEREFLELKQENMMVGDYVERFIELTWLAPHLVTSDRWKFQRGLHKDIWDKISILKITNYEEVLKRSQIAEEAIAPHFTIPLEPGALCPTIKWSCKINNRHTRIRR